MLRRVGSRDEKAGRDNPIPVLKAIGKNNKTTAPQSFTTEAFKIQSITTHKKRREPGRPVDAFGC